MTRMNERGEGAVEERKMRLVLHIEVDEFYADDLQDSADEFYDGDVSVIVLEEMMRSEVGLTAVTLPGQKEQNSDFEVHGTTARIIGAHVQEKGQRRSIAVPSRPATSDHPQSRPVTGRDI